MPKPLNAVGKVQIPLITEPPKSGWLELNAAPAVFPTLAVYRVRWVDNTGEPIAVGRLVGEDATGTLYIGRTQAEKTSRIKGLLKDLAKPSANPKHGLGKKLWRTRFLERIKSGVRCQVGWDELTSYESPQDQKESADVIVERDLLQAYYKQYGELPPFNSSLPGFLK